MTLIQPESGIVLPEDVKQAVENARNNVTFLDAEAARLQKVAVLTKAEVNKGYEEKTNLEKKIGVLETTYTDIATKVSDKETEYDVLVKNLKMIKGEIETMSTMLGDVTRSIDAQKVEIKTKEADLQNQEDLLNKRAYILEQDIAEHKRKVERLKEAIE